MNKDYLIDTVNELRHELRDTCIAYSCCNIRRYHDSRLSMYTVDRMYYLNRLMIHFDKSCRIPFSISRHWLSTWRYISAHRQTPSMQNELTTLHGAIDVFELHAPPKLPIATDADSTNDNETIAEKIEDLKTVYRTSSIPYRHMKIIWRLL